MELLWTNCENVNNVNVLIKSVLVISDMCRIRFYPAEEGEQEKMYLADSNHDNGDGVVQCIASHQYVPVFAFAELSSNPKILIKSYPSFGSVTTLRNPEVSSYISMCFSTTDFLIALTGIDTFSSLEVWNWRTSQLMNVGNTGLLSVQQTISCSSATQPFIIQYARNLKQLKVWNLNFCLDIVKLVEIDLTKCGERRPIVEGYSVADEDTLLFYDNEGNISIISISKRTIQTIVKGMGAISTISQIDNGFLCCTGNQLVRYSKTEEVYCYEKDESFLLPESFKHLFPFKENTLFGVSLSGDLYQISFSSSLEIEHTMTLYWKWKFQAIYGNMIFSLTNENKLELWDIVTKKREKTLIDNLNKDITCMIVNHENSTLIFGTSDSRLLVYLYKELNVYLLAVLYLSNDAITTISATKSFLIAVDESGSHFIIDGSTFEILAFVNYTGIALAFLQLEVDAENLNLFFFEKSDQNSFSSGKLVIFQFCTKSREFKKYNTTLPFPIASVARRRNSNDFIINPYLTKTLQVITINVEYNSKLIQVDVINELQFQSSIQYIQLKTIGDSILAYSLDGSLNLIKDNGEELKTIQIAHRLKGEIKDVILGQEFILATDVDSNVFCIRTGLVRGQLAVEQSTPTPFEPQNRSTIDPPRISWLASRQHKNQQSEMQDNKQICLEIKEEMRQLRIEIAKLINENETKPEDEQLSLQQFNLNERQRELLVKEAVDTDTKLEMLLVIEKERAIHKWMIDNCWEVMRIKSTLVKGIFWNVAVENFALLHDDPELKDELEKTITRYKIEQMTNADKFIPFAPIATNSLEKILSQEPNCCSPQDIQSQSNRQPEVSGTTTSKFKFIPETFDRYTQIEVVSSQQCHAEELFCHFEVLSLKSYFNAKFNELQELKGSQMKAIKEKNDRLRVIQGELNDLARLCNLRQRYKDVIVDPEFAMEEIPERITTVCEAEMSCKPYHAETVRTQQSDDVSVEMVQEQLFNSAFRAKCLQMMMDGVLEIRWEDEIKKTPAVPVALQARKDLRDYDEHDFRAVKEYEEKLKFLGNEREKYTQMLLTEKGKLLADLDHIIRTFNYKFVKLMDVKNDVDMAINQEAFKLLRNRHFNRMRIDLGVTENEIKTTTAGIRKEIGTLTNYMHEFEKKIQDLKGLLETSELKDRQMDKQFKNNFAEVSSHAIVDQAYKFFKRRSRWITKGWATAAIHNDMARRIIARNNDPAGPPLHRDCFDFLHVIDQHDQTTNCPNILDERLWDLLCRMRRSKLESEFKVRAVATQVTEAEEGNQGLAKEITQKKLILASMDKKIAEVKEKKHENMVNRIIQLVMKRGALEVDLMGQLKDFEDVLLVGQSEVEDINSLIRKAGAKKLTAMNSAATFRRKVLHKEWEHQVLKMKIKDMREFVKIVENCKITKDVQRWLVNKQKGRTDDFQVMSLNKEIDLAISGFQREFQQVDDDLRGLSKKILSQQRNNKKLDTDIESLNFEVNEQHKLHDTGLEETIVTDQNNRLSAIAERTRLMKKIQKQHLQIVELTAVLELQRLRTYPTLNEYR